MKTKELLKTLKDCAPVEMAALKEALNEKHKVICEECLGSGIVGDEGPGIRNARLEWTPCDCFAGKIHKSIPESFPEHKAERTLMEARICALEDALNEIFHRTDSTTTQMEIINRVLPQVAHSINPE